MCSSIHWSGADVLLHLHKVSLRILAENLTSLNVQIAILVELEGLQDLQGVEGWRGSRGWNSLHLICQLYLIFLIHACFNLGFSYKYHYLFLFFSFYVTLPLTPYFILNLYHLLFYIIISFKPFYLSL